MHGHKIIIDPTHNSIENGIFVGPALLLLSRTMTHRGNETKKNKRTAQEKNQQGFCLLCACGRALEDIIPYSVHHNSSHFNVELHGRVLCVRMCGNIQANQNRHMVTEAMYIVCT